MPEVKKLYPIPIQDMMVFIDRYVNRSVEDKRKEIMRSLSKTEGMIDVDDKKKEIQNELQKVVDNNEGMKKMVAAVEELLNDLKSKQDVV